MLAAAMVGGCMVYLFSPDISRVMCVRRPKNLAMQRPVFFLCRLP